MKLADIIRETGGKLLCGKEDVNISSFFTDSRETKSGGMFVPIKGERTDSHQYIDSVFENGACASFTELELPYREEPLVLVDNAVEALQRSAAYYRSGFDIPVLGVTGSVGKTTAKEMVALALSSKLKTLKTAGNQNSQIGVPMTVCGLKKDHRAAVVEMGVSLPGEMEKISRVVKANSALITNIGISHIEYLKSRENILEEKLHIADFIPPEGCLFVNGDDELLSELKVSAKGKYRMVSFGVARDADWRASNMRQIESGTFFTCEYWGGSQQMFIPTVGIHNVRNALSALAVAHSMGVELDSAVRALALYKPPAMRQQIIKLADMSVIDDSYNASPDSMKGAIDILSSMEKKSGKTIAILGDMLELGDRAEEEHFRIGSYARESGVDRLIAVGPISESIYEGFGAANAIWVQNASEALEALKDIMFAGDLVLVKASRGMQLDQVVKGLQDS